MKNRILSGLRLVHSCFLLCFNILMSAIRILLYTRLYKISPQLKEMKDKAFVLGNGPSLKQFMEDNLLFLTTQNLVVVNDFFLNKYFTTLRPRVYIIADPGYWEQHIADDMRILRQKMEYVLLKDVDWNMYFCIPTAAYETGCFQRTFDSNPYIHIQPYNTTCFTGTKGMRYFFYDKLLAKPFSGNVIGSAIFIALQMDIKEILLFGVEHSWTRSIYVDEQNRTCIRTDHFYSNEQAGVVWLKTNTEPYKIHEALFDIANMLGGYRQIDEYATHKGIKIYNCTQDSFIDAFERKKWVKPN